MKILSRDFTPKEKVLLLILFLILISLAYYRFVFVPCRESVAEANSERDTLEIELMAAQAKEAQLKRMEEELAGLGKLQETSRMESYNNSKAEISLLNNILETACDYYIAFSDVTRDGNQIRRNFSLQFQTRTFEEAKQIIERLSNGEYRCLLGDMRYDLTQRRATSDGSMPAGVETYQVNGVSYYDIITVETTATFFETMVGGTEDAGLPADKAE